jgi:hypothetical protein
MVENQGRRAAKDSPQSAMHFVHRSAEAIRAGSAGLSQYRAERKALIFWARARGLLLHHTFIEQFEFIGEGAEDRVYWDRFISNRAVKSTLQNRFGFSTQREDLSATPVEYLNRLARQNHLFGDDISILGVFVTDDESHVEIVTSQPWIDVHEERPNPRQDEIDVYMGEFGFESMSYNLDTPLYYNRELDLVAADAHDRNVLRDRRGDLCAIDLVIGRPSPSMRVNFDKFYEDPRRPF